MVVAVVAHSPFLVAARVSLPVSRCPCHVARNPVPVPDAGSDGARRRSGIVPRMPLLMSIRVAEPWTGGAIVALTLLVVAMVALTAWLIHRS
jgi:hypothetical protein